MTDTQEHILVIKHGALGDMILATAGFAAIRRNFPKARLVLLTTKPFAELMAKSPYFDEIWVDSKPKLQDRKAYRRLRDMLNSRRWSWVFDLQASKRSTMYQWLLKRPWPKISNASRWTSHYRGRYDPSRHALDNLRGQLAIAGIEAGDPDLRWLGEAVESLLPGREPYALLVPGGAAHRPDKRWPADHYAALACELVSRKLRPVLIGTSAEAEALESISARVPQAINLGGKTSIAQLAALARGASLAVGNDTGPMHVIAASGCPSLTLFSTASDPARSAPRGPISSYLREQKLDDLSVERVLIALPTPRTT